MRSEVIDPVTEGLGDELISIPFELVLNRLVNAERETLETDLTAYAKIRIEEIGPVKGPAVSVLSPQLSIFSKELVHKTRIAELESHI